MSSSPSTTDIASTADATEIAPSAKPMGADTAAALHVSEAAAFKVYALALEEQDPDLMLRVYITGGGCSGFQYGFKFEEQAQADDTLVATTITWPPAVPGDAGANAAADVSAAPATHAHELPASAVGPDDSMTEQVVVNLLVDPLSLQYLQGAEIDYREDVHGAQFVIRNPNAKTTCGCGSSFAA